LKERYFSPGRAREQALELFPGEGRYAGRGPAFDPGGSALLVLDMQSWFLSPASRAFVPSAPAVLPVIVSLAGRFREATRPVIATRHVNTPDEAGMMGSWWGAMIDPDGEEARLAGEIEAAADLVLDKRRYDAFMGTALEEILRERDVKQVAVTGVMTHLCVETTARSAFMRDFAVFVPADATATYDRELHGASLRALSHGFASITSALDLEEALKKGKR